MCVCVKNSYECAPEIQTKGTDEHILPLKRGGGGGGAERQKNKGGRERERERGQERKRQNSNSKTLFSKDCSLGSFRPV